MDEPNSVEYCKVVVVIVLADSVEPVAVENNNAVAEIDEPNSVEYCNVVVVIVEPCSVEFDVILLAVNCEIISVEALRVELTASVFVVMVEPCSVEFTRIVFANNVETLSDEVTVRFCVVIVEPVIVVLTVIVSVIIDTPVAVLYDRF